jgi:hypothetical protein
MKYYSIALMTLKQLLCFYYQSTRNYNLGIKKSKEITLFLIFIEIESDNWREREDRLCN